MTEFNVNEYVFPIVEGENISSRHFLPRRILGTAFSIKNNKFITAGHVIRCLSQQTTLGLCEIKESRDILFRRIRSFEIIDEYDIAIIESYVSNAKEFLWDFSELAKLYPIQTAGFPYAFDPQRRTIVIRAFKGYIVTSTISFRLQGEPPCYELSFSCSRGLSGAPVYTAGKTPKIKGIVNGNQTSQILVFSDSEIIKEDKETIIERYEAIHFGIAIQTSALRGVESQLLGTKLDNYLVNSGLV